MIVTRHIGSELRAHETSSLIKRFGPTLQSEFKVCCFSFLTFAAYRSWWVVIPFVFDDYAFLFLAFGALQLGVFTSDYFHTKYPPDVRLFHATFIVLASIGCIVNIECNATGCIILGMAFIGLASNFSFIPQPRTESERRTFFYPVVLAWAGGLTYIISASIFEAWEWKWVASYTLFLLLFAFALSFLLNFTRTKASEEVAVWDSLEVMESSVFWIFVMYVALGIPDAVFFSLAAYILKDRFDFTILQVAVALAGAFIIPDTILFIIRFSMSKCNVKIATLIKSWKLRFILAYFAYILFFPLIRFATRPMISIISIQAVELARLAIRDIYRNTLIRTAEFAIPKITFSRWVYTLLFLASCLVNFGIFRIHDWVPFVAGVGVILVAFLRGLYDYFEDRGFYMEDDVISGPEDSRSRQESLNSEQETDKLEDSFTADASYTPDTQEAYQYVSLRHAKQNESDSNLN